MSETRDNIVINTRIPFQNHIHSCLFGSSLDSFERGSERFDEKKSEVRALQADLRRRDSGASQRTDKKRPNAIADLARKKAKAATKSAPSADNRKRDRDATQDSDVDSQKTDDEDDDDDDGTRPPRRRLSIQV